ncbi:hypothetical protein JHN63_19235 [Streptomyces sp. MBT65]|uniref:hypothetical protein n=1 Tax=Streptomyces sp. MBT65 TaxID=1488395 RepID=UPI00190D95EE|nr:hypothetical protein [Streptomyces sp. MBT65]MBK3575910.1 hypothetical protein [Streptomyces sp. MBT65]
MTQLSQPTGGEAATDPDRDFGRWSGGHGTVIRRGTGRRSAAGAAGVLEARW